ncbi:restriction endonuclease subunit S, partial [Candidatus Gracilibacteria bacterium]|nr:restriction endonuclease subunit S [Candidatus Gracilibacteria bacterium]
VGTIGKVCIVRSEFGRFTMQRSLAVLKINQEKVLPFFIYYYLNSDFVQKELNNGANGAAQKGIYLNQLKEITIPLPPLPRQQEIVAYLDRVFTETPSLRSEYEAQIRDLEIMKQSLLEEAFAGRLVTEK